MKKMFEMRSCITTPQDESRHVTVVVFTMEQRDFILSQMPHGSMVTISQRDNSGNSKVYYIFKGSRGDVVKHIGMSYNKSMNVQSWLSYGVGACEVVYRPGASKA